MSEISKSGTERTLLSTDDAMIWAEEFCRIFDGHVIGHEEVEHLDNHQYVGEGTMVGWFANAMQTAITLHEERKRQATEAQKDAFVEGFQEGRIEEV